MDCTLPVEMANQEMDSQQETSVKTVAKSESKMEIIQKHEIRSN